MPWAPLSLMATVKTFPSTISWGSHVVSLYNNLHFLHETEINSVSLEDTQLFAYSRGCMNFLAGQRTQD